MLKVSVDQLAVNFPEGIEIIYRVLIFKKYIMDIFCRKHS